MKKYIQIVLYVVKKLNIVCILGDNISNNW